MIIPRFLQIHTLHSYPAALLNRDDSGLAKRMPFGGAVRTRISSQCLKRHWRDPKDEMRHEYSLHQIPNVATAVRSRNAVQREVIAPLGKQEGIAENVMEALASAFTVGVYGDNAESGEDRQSESTRQPLLLGRPEVEYLQKKVKEICEKYPEDATAAGQIATGLLVTDEKIRRATGSTKTNLRNAKNAAEQLFGNREHWNFEAFRKSTELPAGLEGALFGRMVTSDPGANIEAAVHVAHAFTVHREESESDYFSVVDDLQRDDEDAGAAHIGDMELTAGLFYGYVVVDMPGLVSNLEGCQAGDWDTADRELAAKVVEHLAHLIATVSPGAKLGSTAPYGRARFMLVEAGSSQPYSLADAFRKPVPAQVDDALRALTGEIQGQDACYGVKGARRYMSMTDCDIPGAERLDLDDLASWAADAIRHAKAE